MRSLETNYTVKQSQKFLKQDPYDYPKQNNVWGYLRLYIMVIFVDKPVEMVEASQALQAVRTFLQLVCT